MSTVLILKIAGVGLLVTVTHQILVKAGRDEQALFASIAGVVIVLLMLVGEIRTLFETILSLFDL